MLLIKVLVCMKQKQKKIVKHALFISFVGCRKLVYSRILRPVFAHYVQLEPERHFLNFSPTPIRRKLFLITCET